MKRGNPRAAINRNRTYRGRALAAGRQAAKDAAGVNSAQFAVLAFIRAAERELCVVPCDYEFPHRS